MGGRTVAAIAFACLSLGQAACSEEPGVSSSPASPASPAAAASASDAPPVSSWLAGLRVERDPDALDEDTQTLMGVLGGSLVVSPASCFDGLPDTVGPSTYVLGAVAPTQDRLDALIAQANLEPMFRVEVEVLCTD